MPYLDKRHFIYAIKNQSTMKFRLLIGFALVALIATETLAQKILDTEANRDSIFLEWNSTSVPGVATGIIHDGTITYLKGFGMADLAHGIKNTVDTKFHLGALSKQFTSLALLWLIEKGELGLNENIQKYIPQLPIYKEPILVKHVLNHTTGLNDINILKSLVGCSEEDPFTQEDAIRLICSQHILNGRPGANFSSINSDTEPTLMAAIISKVSGHGFASFMQEHIFKPLGLSQTFVRDDYKKIMEDVAISYQVTDEGLKHALWNNSNVGASSLYTTARDLARWYTFFDTNHQGIEDLVRRLDTPVKTDDGRTYDSGWGQMTLGRSFLHLERGIPKYWQFGMAGGYAANVFRFPEQSFTSFVIGNNDRYNGAPAMYSAGLYMDDKYQAPSVVTFDEKQVKHLTADQLSVFEGYYWNEKNGFARKIYVEDDTLRYSRIGLASENAMIPLDDHVFQLVVGSDDVLIATFDLDSGAKKYSITIGESSPTDYISYLPRAYGSDELEAFCGMYFNSDLNTSYNFSVTHGELIASHVENGQISFFAIKEDTFRGDREFLRNITFQRTPKGFIEGFTIKVEGIKDLKFTKYSEEPAVN